MMISNGSNDPFTGQLVADSVDYQNAELHDATFVVVPEPGPSAAWIGAAALVLALSFRNCHRASAEY
jgi:hypothetical protein